MRSRNATPQDPAPRPRPRPPPATGRSRGTPAPPESPKRSPRARLGRRARARDTADKLAEHDDRARSGDGAGDEERATPTEGRRAATKATTLTTSTRVETRRERRSRRAASAGSRSAARRTGAVGGELAGDGTLAGGLVRATKGLAPRLLGAEDLLRRRRPTWRWPRRGPRRAPRPSGRGCAGSAAAARRCARSRGTRWRSQVGIR